MFGPRIIDPTVEALARKAPELSLSLEELDKIAALAMRITRLAAERSGVPLEPIHMRDYGERTSQERAAMRAGVQRVLQALILLGWIEPPSVEVAAG